MAIEAATLSDVQPARDRGMAGRPDQRSATSHNAVGAVRSVMIAAFVGVVALTALVWTLSFLVLLISLCVYPSNPSGCTSEVRPGPLAGAKLPFGDATAPAE